MRVASCVEKPDCVRAQAMAVAVLMISRMAPDRQAVHQQAEPLASKQR